MPTIKVAPSDVVLDIIGGYIDDTPSDTWPPLLPSASAIARRVGRDDSAGKHAITKRLMHLNDMGLLIAREKAHYTLTASGIAVLYDMDHLRRFIRLQIPQGEDEARLYAAAPALIWAPER